MILTRQYLALAELVVNHRTMLPIADCGEFELVSLCYDMSQFITKKLDTECLRADFVSGCKSFHL